MFSVEKMCKVLRLSRSSYYSWKNHKPSGRALQKHGSRPGSMFPKATGNASSINSQGATVLKGILKNPNATSVVRHHARFGWVLEYKLPNGSGARFSKDGKTFIGFIEP